MCTAPVLSDSGTSIQRRAKELQNVFATTRFRDIGVFFHTFILLSLGQRIPYIQLLFIHDGNSKLTSLWYRVLNKKIPRSSLNRGSLNRGSIVSTKE